MDRRFTETAQDKLWVTDITENPTREGKVYCAVVLNAFFRRVVGWSVEFSPTTALVTDVLDHVHRLAPPQAGNDHPLGS